MGTKCWEHQDNNVITLLLPTMPTFNDEYLCTSVLNVAKIGQKVGLLKNCWKYANYFGGKTCIIEIYVLSL